MIYLIKSNLEETVSISMSLSERQKFNIMNERGEDIYKVTEDRTWTFVPPVLERVKTFSGRSNVKQS